MSALDDRDLRDRFAELRAEVGDSAEPFHAARARALQRSRIPHRRRMLVALACAAAAVVLIVRGDTSRTGSRNAPVLDLGDARWRAPTDFLLATPGSELLSDVPRFGAPASWSGATDSASTVEGHQ